MKKDKIWMSSAQIVDRIAAEGQRRRQCTKFIHYEMTSFIVNVAQDMLQSDGHKSEVEVQSSCTLAQSVPDLVTQCIDIPFAVPFACPSKQSDAWYVYGCQRLRHLALLQLPAFQYCDLPLVPEDLISLVLKHREQQTSSNASQSTTQTQVVDCILAFMRSEYNHNANARFLFPDGSHDSFSQETVAEIVADCCRDMQANGIQHEKFPAGQLAAICVLHCKLQHKKQDLKLSRRTPLLHLRMRYIPVQSTLVMPLAMHRTPEHVGQTANDLPYASAPVVCQLCNSGFSSINALQTHCAEQHGNWSEYRKIIFFSSA